MQLLKKIFRKISRFISEIFLRFDFLKRSVVKPKVPVNAGDKTYVHIGCGEINAPEFINIDARPHSHVHIVTDDLIGGLQQFPDDSIDLVYMSHLLEHISHREVLSVLKNIYKKIAKEGVLRIGVPDFDYICDIYTKNGKNMESIILPLMGAQDYPYNFHYGMFNEQSLTTLLLKAGFTSVRRWDPETVDHHDFEDWSSRKIVVNDVEYPISLNLEGVK